MPAEPEQLPCMILGSDYGAPTPLWVPMGRNLDPVALGLREDLVDSLLAWQRHFDEHFRHDLEPGWDSGESAAWYASEGTRLQIELSSALPDREVALDLWPVDGTAPSF